MNTRELRLGITSAVLGLQFVVVLTANATTEHYVKSIHDGQTPYLLSLGKEGDEGGARRPPGIYFASHAGMYEPIVNGVLIQGGTTLGLLAELSMTTWTKRYEAIAAADGKLHLFCLPSINAKNTQPYVIVIGGPKALIRDLQGNLVQLPPVIRPENVVIHQMQPKPDGSQAVLISIRFDEPSAFGDGVTFGFVVDAPRGPSLNQLRLSHEPLLIANRFLTSLQISQLSRNRVDQIFLPHELKSLERERIGDPITLKDWRKSIGAIADWLAPRPEYFGANRTRKKTKDPNLSEGQDLLRKVAHTVPYYDFGTRAYQSVGLLVQSHPTRKRLEVTEVYDPVHGKDAVLVSWGGFRSPFMSQELTVQNRWMAFGRMDFNSKGAPRIFKSDASANDSFIAYVNGKPILFFTHQNEIRALNLPLPTILDILSKQNGSKLLESFQLEWYMPANKTNDTESNIYGILVSTKIGDEKNTVYLEFSVENQTPRISRSFTVAQDFYEDSELQNRLAQHTESTHYLFDVATPHCQSPSIYKNTKRDTTARINLNGSFLPNSPHSNAFQYDFLKPLFEKQFGPITHVYREYDSTGLSADQSGVYMLDVVAVAGKTDWITLPAPYISGKALKFGAGKEKEFELASGGVGISEFESPIIRRARVSVFATTPLNEQGEKTFMLNALLTRNSSTAAEGTDTLRLPLTLLTEKFGFPFSRFAGAQVITDHDDREATVNILVLVSADSKSAIHPNGAVLSFSSTIGFNPYKHGEMFRLKASSKPITLSPTAVQPTEVLNRIRKTKDAKSYWIDTPELSEIDAGYFYLQLSSGERVQGYELRGKLLNRDQTIDQILGKKTSRPGNQGSSDNEDGYEYGGFFSLGTDNDPWRVYSQYSLENLWYGTHKLNTTALATYPSLIETLDGLADATKPPQHQVFIVSNADKATFRETIRQLVYAGEYTRTFAVNNDSLKLYVFNPQKASQDLVRSNLKSARGANGRPLLIAEAELLAQVPRPLPKQREGKNSNAAVEEAETAENNDGFLETGADDLEKRVTDFPLPKVPNHLKSHPHILTLLGNEGEDTDVTTLRSGKAPAAKVSMVVIATPNEWDELMQSSDRTARATIARRFTKNVRYLSSPWKLWPPGSPYATAETNKLQERSGSELEQQVFPNLGPLLNGLADTQKKPQHRALIVPKELKPLIKSMIFGRWAGKIGPPENWNSRNSEMALFNFGSGSIQAKGNPFSQDSIYSNLSDIRMLAEGLRPVVVADVNDVKRVGRPTAAQGDTWQIADFAADTEKNRLSLGDSAQSTGSNIQTPHAVYALELEGKRTQPKDLEAVRANGYQISTLYLGTQEEWDSLRHEAGFENRFNLFEQIGLEYLAAPSTETKVKLLTEMIQSHIGRTPGFHADLGDNTNPKTSTELIIDAVTFLVNRAELLSAKKGRNQTEAFIALMSELSRMLVEDIDVRARKKLDRNFIERIMAKVFSIPLNLEILPEKDYLRRFSSHHQAALDLGNIGYEGSLDIKLRFIRSIMAQTQTNSVKNLPSSAIVFGDTSTGKTFSFLKLAQLAGLQMYDYNNSGDENASAMVVRVQQLVSVKEAGSDSMSVDEAIAHIRNFLSLPQGYRGWLLFDDIHKGDAETQKKLLTFIQSFFDTKDGLMTVTNFEGVPRIIPVRNLVLWMTLNPTGDAEKRKRYRSESDHPNEQDKIFDTIIATLSTNDFQVEKSFLARFGAIFNLSNFPTDAKGPKLHDVVREGSGNEFSVSGKFLMVSPAAVNHVVNAFPTSNAREFLSEAPAKLQQIPVDQKGGRGSIFIVVPKTHLGARMRLGPYPQTSQLEHEGEGPIADHVQKHLVTVPVNQRLDGQLQFTNVLVDSFRTSLLGSLVYAVNNDLEFSRNARASQDELAPFLHAVTSHLSEHAYIPMSELKLDPLDFGAKTTPARREFESIRDAEIARSALFFPVTFGEKQFEKGILQRLLQARISPEEEMTRAHVLGIYSAKLRAVFEKYLLKLSRGALASNSQNATAEWLSSLNLDSPKRDLEKLGTEFLTIFREFYLALYDEGLVENMNAGKFASAEYYDVVRLFMMTFDRAITEMPWGPMTRFMISAIELAAKDTRIGSGRAVIDYFFASKHSLLRPASHELIYQIASSSDAYRNWDKTKIEQKSKDFGHKCTRLLVQNGRGSQP